MRPVLGVGEPVPDFVAESTTAEELDCYETIDGAWSVILVIPKSFDAVFTSDLAALAALQREFANRKVRVLAVSCDTRNGLQQWRREAQDIHSCPEIEFPLVADPDASIADAFGLVSGDATGPPRGLAPASLLVVADPSRNVQFLSQYPSTTGRNFEDLLRTLDALQLGGVRTGVNWMPGEDVFVRDEDPKGRNFFQIEPWFRLAPPPTDDDDDDVDTDDEAGAAASGASASEDRLVAQSSYLTTS
mmetsp:Transcript_27866/g.85484  ORF Transcript_27866/g.85484 Transcript_27866/m.85484 type:complete len:246 (+) Transcript_27866:20-757(+)